MLFRSLLDLSRIESGGWRPNAQPVDARPPYWGGYRLVPRIFEFWQDRPHRLHERRVFLARGDGSWDQGLLYP